MNNYQENNNTNNNSKVEREKLNLNVEHPDEFKSTIKTTITNTVDLVKKINGFFRAMGIVDFYGSTLKPNPTTGQLELVLYFKPDNNTDGIHFVEPVVGQTNRNSNATARVLSLNTRNSGRTVQLSLDGKDVLQDFILKGYNQKIDWNRYSTEVTEQAPFGSYYNIYLRVYNIDINKILKCIWGGKDEQGGRYEYAININRVIPGSDNLIITIQQLNEKNLQEIAAKIGIVSGVGNFNIIR